MNVSRVSISSLVGCALMLGACSPGPKASASESEADRRMKETASDSAESRQPFGPNSPGTNTLGTGENAVPLRKPGEPIDAPPPGKLPKGVGAPSAENAQGTHTSAEETQRANSANPEEAKTDEPQATPEEPPQVKAQQKTAP